jgi:hypothetical protein
VADVVRVDCDAGLRRARERAPAGPCSMLPYVSGDIYDGNTLPPPSMPSAEHAPATP